MVYDIRCEHVSSRPLAVVRRRASAQDLSKVIPEACGRVWNAVQAKNITGAGRLVALYLDDDRPAWWLGGLAFVAIELVVHLVLQLVGRPSFYNGRG